MKNRSTLKHEFVDFIPEELSEGIIYISVRFGTASHLCACGCKQKVVTPIRPSDWTLTFDGKTISLHPSIGNGNYKCRSHYWIEKNEIIWADERWKKNKSRRQPPIVQALRNAWSKLKGWRP